MASVNDFLSLFNSGGAGYSLSNNQTSTTSDAFSVTANAGPITTAIVNNSNAPYTVI